VIANHKLVSFHAAFISSVLSLPRAAVGKLETLGFMFLSWETLISVGILYVSWHVGIAVHEMGHFLTAARLNSLNPSSQEASDAMREKGWGRRMFWLSKMFLTIPWGGFYGVKKEHGNFAPDAPYNLAVSAAGPVWSGVLAAVCLPVAAVGIGLGLAFDADGAIYVGRFFLAPGLVGLLDRFLADRGKLREYRTREERASEKATRGAAGGAWMQRAAGVKEKILGSRLQMVELSRGTTVGAPWQFRNCAMGGRHTEKQYPESNVSMQESMFVPLSAETYEEAQEMTVSLQSRLKEIIESAPGAKVMGVGLEGGLAPYVDPEPQDMIPEQRVWRMMKQAILDCGYRPGVDVAIALDPAASELENAYRQETGQDESIGMYRFWRDKGKLDMSRDEILRLYIKTMQEDDVPILSIEDGFGELDHAGWKMLMSGDPDSGMEGLGDRILIVADDLVTTKDESIERCARNKEMNATLIKANQIGTLSETVLAALTSLAYGAELVVSHRSKSPNDPFEAEIAAAMNAVGIKAGGGANTERLQKYGRVVEILTLAEQRDKNASDRERSMMRESLADLACILTGRPDLELDETVSGKGMMGEVLRLLPIQRIYGKEEPTNAGIPSVAATVLLGKSGTIRFKGSTPLGTSAGVDEAVHYVDSIIQPGKITSDHPELFTKQGDGTFRFRPGLKEETVLSKGSDELASLWRDAQRYGGMGCKRAVEHIDTIIANAFEGRRLSDLGTVLDVDRSLLRLECEKAILKGALSRSADKNELIHVMQRKAFLGMNAILSVSLALGRAIAARDGRELWELLRHMATETMEGFVMANSDLGQDDLSGLDFNQLVVRFREVAASCSDKSGSVHAMLREQLPIYRADWLV
jgi:enolase